MHIKKDKKYFILLKKHVLPGYRLLLLTVYSSESFYYKSQIQFKQPSVFVTHSEIMQANTSGFIEDLDVHHN